MKTQFVSKLFLPLLIAFLPVIEVEARKRLAGAGRAAVVVDERLSALRATPELSGALVRRVSRGGLVAVTTAKTSRDGVVFYKVNVSRRINGWMQRDAVVTHTRPGDDARLLKLIKASEDFDAIVRARIFWITSARRGYGRRCCCFIRCLRKTSLHSSHRTRVEG